MKLVTTTLSSGIWDSFDIATAAHEYVHAFGVPDYYHYIRDVGTPVGMWDLIARITEADHHFWQRQEREYRLDKDLPKKVLATKAQPTLYGLDSAYYEWRKESDISFIHHFHPVNILVEYRRPARQKYSADLDQNMSGAGLIVSV